MDKAERQCIDCNEIFIKYGKNLRCVECHFLYKLGSNQEQIYISQQEIKQIKKECIKCNGKFTVTHLGQKKCSICRLIKRKCVLKKYSHNLLERMDNIKYRAKKDNRICNITLADLEYILNQPCYYCGKLLQEKRSMSIDRKDNNQGYIKENCVSACMKCNRIKGQRTLEEFVMYLESKEGQVV